MTDVDIATKSRIVLDLHVQRVEKSKNDAPGAFLVPNVAAEAFLCALTISLIIDWPTISTARNYNSSRSQQTRIALCPSIHMLSVSQLEAFIRPVNLGIERLDIRLPSHQTLLPPLPVRRAPSIWICPVPLQCPVGGGGDLTIGVRTGITVHMRPPMATDNRSVSVPLTASVVPTSVTLLEPENIFDLIR